MTTQLNDGAGPPGLGRQTPTPCFAPNVNRLVKANAISRHTDGTSSAREIRILTDLLRAHFEHCGLFGEQPHLDDQLPGVALNLQLERLDN